MQANESPEGSPEEVKRRLRSALDRMFTRVRYSCADTIDPKLNALGTVARFAWPTAMCLEAGERDEAIRCANEAGMDIADTLGTMLLRHPDWPILIEPLRAELSALTGTPHTICVLVHDLPRDGTAMSTASDPDLVPVRTTAGA